MTRCCRRAVADRNLDAYHTMKWVMPRRKLDVIVCELRATCAHVCDPESILLKPLFDSNREVADASIARQALDLLLQCGHALERSGEASKAKRVRHNCA